MSVRMKYTAVGPGAVLGKFFTFEDARLFAKAKAHFLLKSESVRVIHDAPGGADTVGDFPGKRHK